MLDTGDRILHRPTGETWIVACVQGDRLSWCGWPRGTAALSDCTLVKKATAEERHKLLREMAEMSTSDHRQRYAQVVLEKERHD